MQILKPFYSLRIRQDKLKSKQVLYNVACRDDYKLVCDDDKCSKLLIHI